MIRDIVKQPFWAMSSGETLAALQSSTDGLDESEVVRRREIFGRNQISLKRRLTKTRILLNQLAGPLIIILMISGGITIFLREWIDAIVIFSAVGLNAMLGYWQENKAETVLDALTSYIRTRIRVRRNGTEREIDAAELVPGDIIRLTPGDRIPADGRLIQVNELEANEAVVTGESLPEKKRVDAAPIAAVLADRACLVWSGTLITQGLGEAVVIATGTDTEFGRIAALVAAAKQEPTPLQRSVSRFTLNASAFLAVLTLAMFAFGLFRGLGIYDMFLIAVAVGVSAVPESLPIAMTVILAIGVERLAKKRAVVRKLSAAETLGATTVILTDKTGTLTEAKMTLAHIKPAVSEDKAAQRHLLHLALCNTDVVVENPQDSPDRQIISGRPAEVALVRAAGEQNHTAVLDRIPFDSRKKYSVSLIRRDHGAEAVYLGAPDILLAASQLSDEQRHLWKQTIDQAAEAGERVLGVATRAMARATVLPRQTGAEDLEFQGIISFHDPLRPNAADAIRRITDRGVRVVIVTGDHRGTAVAVAKELGMINGKGAVVTGEEFATLSERDILGRLPDIRVFARVTPEQKSQIVALYRTTGARVAVVGDGVNDAPALETADIGVAVGSGTDVAKSAADLVILDDNIETLVGAIEEGHKIISNIRKATVYLLSDALDELILITGALIVGVPLPITALQILFINLLSDSIPALAFAFEPLDDASAKRDPKKSPQLFDPHMKRLILTVGTLGSVFVLMLYLGLLRLGLDADYVRTFIFAAFGTNTIFTAFSLRSLHASILSYHPFGNKVLNFGAFFGLLLTFTAIYHPAMQHVLHTVSLPWPWLIGIVAVGLSNVALVELGKRVLRKFTA